MTIIKISVTCVIGYRIIMKTKTVGRADKPEDLDAPDKSEGISTSTGSIIKRWRNALALDITGADALSVILDHVTKMEHWNAYAELNRDLNTLRTYKRFRFVSDVIDQQRYTNRLITNVVYTYRSLQVVEFQ